MESTAWYDIFSTPSFQTLVGLCLGVGLSASCGLRIFIPPLILSAAALYFGVPMPEPLSWLNTYPAFFAFLTASLLEIAAYYVPWLDNFLDAVTTPVAIVAGTVMTYSFLGGEMDPVLKVVIAIIAGGGAAGTVQSLTNTSRVASLATTAGVANPIVSTIENILAIVLSILTIAFPVFVGILIIVGLAILVLMVRVLWPKKKKVKEIPPEQADST